VDERHPDHVADLAARVERERAELRAYLAALGEALRCALELESLLEFLPLEERCYQVVEIFERLEHYVNGVSQIRRGP